MAYSEILKHSELRLIPRRCALLFLLFTRKTYKPGSSITKPFRLIGNEYKHNTHTWTSCVLTLSRTAQVNKLTNTLLSLSYVFCKTVTCTSLYVYRLHPTLTFMWQLIPFREMYTAINGINPTKNDGATQNKLLNLKSRFTCFYNVPYTR